ncbi:MAG: peptidoglycan DD-metalloendopeptidase family protein [Clostridia bacterium]|nr:peptidoglycan DD-metalloendopeptidase family protein [Clostridia bacterium]
MRFPFETGGVRLTSPYGERQLAGTSGFHGGVDLVGLESYEVVSVAAGTVAASTVVNDKSNGNWMWGEHVIIAGDDGRVYFYFHLASRTVKRFDRVEAGQVIGVMGNTGYSFGAHLHFEVRESDAATTVNAAEILGIPNEEGVYQATEEANDMDEEKFAEAFLQYVSRNTGDECSPWAEDYVKWAKDAGIFLSDGNGNYRWTAPITREELCAVLYRVLRLFEDGTIGGGK